jgi:hypothetical protein
VEDHDKETVGGLAGFGTGLFAGAKLGGAVIPIPFVGPVVGAVAGSVLGTEIGKTVGRAVINGATAFVETFAEKPEPAS